jgi:tetratricopeptide (TPR) repeat protein
MNFKTSIAISLGLVLTSAAFFNDVSTAQTQSRKPASPCKRFNCGNPSPGGTYGDGNLPPFIKIIKEIISKGDAFMTEGKHDLAKEQYSQALELSQSQLSGSAEGEAMAHSRLGELSTITGNFEEASTHLTAAKTIYQTLQNKEGINSVNLQLVRVQEIQLQQIQQQINRSQLQIRQR